MTVNKTKPKTKKSAQKSKKQVKSSPKNNKDTLVQQVQNRVNLRRVNKFLVVLIISINAYIFLLPFTPQLNYWFKKITNNNHGLPYQTQLTVSSNKDQTVRAKTPQDERLIIPKLNLDQHIFQGSSPYTVNKGVWARPRASIPQNGGNTVLVGHRYTYSGPSVFYELDKVKVGDSIIVYWEGKEYDYQVSSSRVVPATDISVEAQTSQPRLTLYTCTPLWSFTERLVVVALLINKGISK